MRERKRGEKGGGGGKREGGVGPVWPHKCMRVKAPHYTNLHDILCALTNMSDSCTSSASSSSHFPARTPGSFPTKNSSLKVIFQQELFRSLPR